MDGACWVCFCCWHSPVKDMNIRIFWVRAMKCMYAQTRPRFILSSEGVFGGMEFEPMLTPREKSPLPKISPEEDRTCDAVDSEPKHYQLSYSGPRELSKTDLLTTLKFQLHPDKRMQSILPFLIICIKMSTLTWKMIPAKHLVHNNAHHTDR